MRRLAVSVLLLLSTGARDAPSPVAQRIATFAHDVCLYGAAHPRRGPRDSARLPPEPRFASHFGRIVKTSAADDSGLRTYALAVPQLPGWDVTFNGRHFEVVIPPEEQPLLGDLARLLGEPQRPKDCQTVNVNPLETPPKPIRSMEFTPDGWPPSCGMFVDVVHHVVNGKSEYRVIKLYISAPG